MRNSITSTAIYNQNLFIAFFQLRLDFQIVGTSMLFQIGSFILPTLHLPYCPVFFQSFWHFFLHCTLSNRKKVPVWKTWLSNRSFAPVSRLLPSSVECFIYSLRRRSSSSLCEVDFKLQNKRKFRKITSPPLSGEKKEFPSGFINVNIKNKWTVHYDRDRIWSTSASILTYKIL